MADVKWSIRASEFVNCNRSYGCPCQFNGRPSCHHWTAVSRPMQFTPADSCAQFAHVNLCQSGIIRKVR